jgi:CheY-like chemotaxis protein
VLTGRKLLLADDSLAIQKVIDLTFSDEGMKVTTVSDGRSALNELEHFPPPDVVLADVFMPEVNGYEVCRLIKQSDRFAQIPVILLVSSFEPFDEAEARRAGADDIVTKPFQSIRQLVSRVGSLLGGSDAENQPAARQYSTLGLTQVEPQTDEAPATAEHNVTVLVEAPMMNTHESEEEAARAPCAADVELQTADTKKLERITDEHDEARSADADDPRLQDTIELEAINYSEERESAPAIEAEPMHSQFAETTEIISQPAATEPLRAPDDGLLDLDDTFAEEVVSDDVYLDLDFEEPLPARVIEATAEPESVPEATFTGDVIAAEAVTLDESAMTADTHAWSIVSDMTTSEVPVAVAEDKPASIEGGQGSLSAEAIDAIARRVVEQMSDQAVREIAWEVVPDLAELLIKKKLEEQK